MQNSGLMNFNAGDHNLSSSKINLEWQDRSVLEKGLHSSKEYSELQVEINPTLPHGSFIF